MYFIWWELLVQYHQSNSRETISRCQVWRRWRKPVLKFLAANDNSRREDSDVNKDYPERFTKIGIVRNERYVDCFGCSSRRHGVDYLQARFERSRHGSTHPRSRGWYSQFVIRSNSKQFVSFPSG